MSHTDTSDRLGPSPWSQGLQVSLLRELAAVRALAPRWSELCDRCPDATPFQRPQWLLPWMERFGGDEPWVFAVMDRGRLCGLVPLFRYGQDGARVLASCGAGISDRLDVLAEPGCRSEAIAAIERELYRHRDSFDVLVLDELPPDSAWGSLADHARWRSTAQPQSPWWALELPESVAELGRVVPLEHLKKFRYYERRLAREVDLGLRRASLDEVDGFLDDLFALHGARWGPTSSPGC